MEIRRKTLITINNQDVTSSISSGTIKLTEMIADGEFQFGQLCADMFECQIYGYDDDIVGSPIFVNVVEDETLAYLKANNDYLIDHESNKYVLNSTPSQRLFTGIIDSCKKDYTNTYRDIVAYNFKRQDEDVTTWWNTFWALQDNSPKTATVKTVRQALINHMGITEIDKVLPNDSLIISATPVSDSTVTFNYVIKCLGEIQRCFPHINRDGVMEYITLGTTAKNVNNLYEINNTTWEDNPINKITGVAIYSTSDTFIQGTGTYDNAYTIAGNIFLLNMDSSALNTFLTAYLNAIKDIQYTPCSISMIVSDLAYRLGDKLSFNNNVGYVFENIYSGVQYVDEVMSCYGDVNRSQRVSSINNTMMESRKFSEVRQTIDGITTQVGELTTDLHENYSTTQQTATMIKTEVASIEVGGVNMIKESDTYDYSEYIFI